MIKSVEVLNTGEKISFDYATKTVDGKSFEVVSKINESGGTPEGGNYETQYTYDVSQALVKTDDRVYIPYIYYCPPVGTCDFFPNYWALKLNMNMVYWGNVIATNQTGSTEYQMEIDENKNLGAIKNIKLKNNLGVKVSEQTLQYSNPVSNYWFLLKDETTQDNVTSTKGTSPLGDWDYKWSRYAYEKNSDNSTRITINTKPIMYYDATHTRKLYFGSGGGKNIFYRYHKCKYSTSRIYRLVSFPIC